MSQTNLAASMLAEHAAEIRRLGKRVVADVIEIGRHLSECKAICGHGNWLLWLAREFGWTDDTALNFMRVHDLSESRNFRDLSLPLSGLYLLAAPSTPDEARDVIIERAQAGETLSVADIKQIIDTAKSRQTLDDEQRETVWLEGHLHKTIPYPLPKAKPKFHFTNEQISWAAWSWNPVTGCLHGCKYCYAREMAMRPSFKEAYPAGFEPLFHHERLDAPANTSVPDRASIDPKLRRVFVCSMADLYGKWVPQEWIDAVHASCISNPQWDYLMLTKFPRRYVGLQLPPTAWLGTSVDEQKRVRLAEEAFRQIKGVRVKWLSLEPLLEPLEFTDLSMFDWVVIGAQSATNQPPPVGHVPEFAPPVEWVMRIVAQAREAGCGIWMKENLLGDCHSQSPGMKLIQEEPARRALLHDARGGFLLRAVP